MTEELEVQCFAPIIYLNPDYYGSINVTERVHPTGRWRVRKENEEITLLIEIGEPVLIEDYAPVQRKFLFWEWTENKIVGLKRDYWNRTFIPDYAISYKVLGPIQECGV